MIDELDGMVVFVAVADAKGFRAAGERLGVSASAVSQALRKLEERVGVALVQRTTRSVRLTEAGERLYAVVRPGLEEVRATVAALREMGDEPRGTLRLHVSSAADSVLTGAVLADFLAAHPHVHFDFVVSDAQIDIVDAGYDAGIQIGEVIEQDMIAVPVTGDVKLVVVGAPSYFARHPKPKHPRDVVEHDCINWHPTGDAPPYRWEFTEDGRDFAVAVRARLLTTDPALIIRLARAGAGLAMLYEGQAREDMSRGDLVPVLEEFCPPFPGFYLFYPQRRHASRALRAFIEHLRGVRHPLPRRSRRPERTRGGV